MFRAIGVVVSLLGVFSAGCGQQEPVGKSFESQLVEALVKTGQDRTAIILPKVPYPVSTPARLVMVDKAMHDPPSMVDLSSRLLAVDSGDTRSMYTRRLLMLLGLNTRAADVSVPAPVAMSAVLDQLGEAGPSGTLAGPPVEWASEDAFAAALRTLLHEAVIARQAWGNAYGNPLPEELLPLQDLIVSMLKYRGKDPNEYRLLNDAYHELGARQNPDALAKALVGILTVVEHSLPALQQTMPVAMEGEWLTPLGRVKVAGMGDDTHSGEFLLLIDPGGNDIYEDVGSVPEPGRISIVIDLQGNDVVRWDEAPGPGTGLLGLGVWMDMAGDDRYTGGNLGLGSGLLGAGLLWDAGGNDSYDAQGLSQGVGQYGIGILFDDSGNDHYRSILNGQGYGGSGGFGMLMDLDGNDDYFCGGAIPDPVKRRAVRHRSRHYLSLCQGFGFGLRAKISGGIGLLLDRKGNDHYKADIFGQGAAYWFGLGLLVEGAGDDRYEGFEHVQGEGLHLSAGLLSDWGGNDHYSGYEHAQGVGKDRGAGVLFDATGNDVYQSVKESQGAGLSSYGVGILVDSGGNDHYKARLDSQGYSGRPDPGFPDSEWPTGILLDLGGTDIFDQPYAEEVDAAGRIQNKQGVAVNYEGE
ncbi:MAG: hypothetical protein ACE5FQ_08280 [Thiogranum sp.]